MNSDEVKELREKIRFYETILDNIYNGVMITDPDKWQVLPFGMKSETKEVRSDDEEA